MMENNLNITIDNFNNTWKQLQQQTFLTWSTLWFYKSEPIKLGDGKHLTIDKIEVIATRHDKCDELKLTSIRVDAIAAPKLHPACRNVHRMNPFDIAMMSATNLSMNSMFVNIDSQLLKSICKDCVVTNELVWISMQNIANQQQSMKIAMFNMLQHLQIQQHQTQQS